MRSKFEFASEAERRRYEELMERKPKMIRVADLSVDPRYFKWNFVDQENLNIENYIKKKEYLYDANSCGDETNYWVVVKEGNPRFYRSEHDWYWHNYDEEDAYLVNEFDIQEVDRQDLNEEARKNLRFII